MSERPQDHAEPSVFRPENLLREARRQRGLPDAPVPALCVLDPDGDIVRALRHRGVARPVPGWACYHTDMVAADVGGAQVGFVGCAVGASFAVLIAEQLAASGCRLIVSVTSSGRIAEGGPDHAFFILIDAALRDEGTSGHYAPRQSDVAEADPGLIARAAAALHRSGIPAVRGMTWTTDAPYRETERAIAWARGRGALAVEMEAAALYAFAQARGAAVICLAHVTNRMAQTEGDFEKGDADGADDALRVIAALATLVG